MRRKLVNVVMFSLTGLCAVMSVGILFFILGYLLWQGGTSLNWDFFTRLPAPVGEVGGGMANAIVGSGKLLVMATLFGVPVGFLAGVYLAEFGGVVFPMSFATPPTCSTASHPSLWAFSRTRSS